MAASSSKSPGISFKFKKSSSGSTPKPIASQYFQDDAPELAAQIEGQDTTETVIELINQAQLFSKDAQKIENLRKVQEIIIHKEPTLLDNFLDEVLQFQHDRSPDVRKFVVGFIEETIKQDPQLLPNVTTHLNIIMLNPQQHVAVMKKAILCNSQLIRLAMKWLIDKKNITEELEGAWSMLWDMKDRIKVMLDSENDGIRTHAIKYAESIVVAFSEKTAESDGNKKTDIDVSLAEVADDHPLFKKSNLLNESKHSCEALRSLLITPSITSVNLMACLGSLTSIAKQRPVYMPKVIESFETLHVNLPPTLAKSQVSSVRKHMKMQLVGILKHSAAIDFVANISTLLADLGVSEQEIAKNIPKGYESLKRQRTDGDGEKSRKRQKTKQPLLADDDDDINDLKKSEKPIKKTPQKMSMIDMLAEELKPLLQSSEDVANLVLISMVALPDTMPAQFQSTYTPIAAAGTETQIKHLARMMANQFAAVGIQPKNAATLREEKEEPSTSEKPAVEKKAESRGSIEVLGGSSHVPTMVPPPEPVKKPPQPIVVPSGPRRITKFKLSDVTVPLSQPDAQTLFTGAVNRIIKSKKLAQLGGASQARLKILSGLVTQFSGENVNVLLDYILEDLRGNADLAITWLYQEYAKMQGYMPEVEEGTESFYNDLLCSFLSSLLKKADQRDGLFTRFVMEAPIITTQAVKVIRRFCEDEVHFYAGIHALRELILKKPAFVMRYLQELLELTYHERTEVRSQAIQYVKRLYERPDLRDTIEEFSKECLRFLLNEKPPLNIIHHLSNDMKARTAKEGWFEELIKLCLYLFLALLPVNQKLIHDLANVYVGANANTKRTVLRVLETPVRGMGMESPELLLLVENCPKGGETLVTRMLHILTDKAPPTPELVERVRDLYHKRVSDVRFLIPVLIGLDKKEVISALPKLIKLNPIVVKEVFHRLLLSHQGDNSAGQSPLSPAELLIALHNIDHTKCDMKSIIKATSLCYNEKNIYTQEVLAVVIQKLMEESPLPTLLMRTVIQSLGMYPRLSGFVMNILQRLIVKQVWKQPKVWEGFVKCCERTKPQSFGVLLQLPYVNLKDVFIMSPDLRIQLLDHVRSFTPHQQSHIPKEVMQLLEKDPLVEVAEQAQMEHLQVKDKQQRAVEQKMQQENTGISVIGSVPSHHAPIAVLGGGQKEPVSSIGTIGGGGMRIKQEPMSSLYGDNPQNENRLPEIPGEGKPPEDPSRPLRMTRTGSRLQNKN